MQLHIIALSLAALTLLALLHKTEAVCSVNPTEITDFHNYLRRNLVPRGADVNALQWDADLAVLAQRVSDTCKFEHSTGPEYEDKGENLYQGGSCDFKQILTLMFLEREMYNYTTNHCDTSSSAKYTFFGTCGHYYQLASAAITRVGCGITKCGQHYLAACEYDRHYSLPPYQAGEPGTKCQHWGAGYTYNGLCYSRIPYMPQPPASAKLECKIQCLNEGVRVDTTFACQCNCPISNYYGTRCEKHFGTNRIGTSCLGLGVTCENGGVPTLLGDTCNCVCPSGFRGNRCQENIILVDNSAYWHFGLRKRYQSYYPVDSNIMTDKFVNNALLSFVTSAVNNYCKNNFKSCCPEADTSTTDQDFIDYYAYQITPGYPKGAIDGSLKVGIYFQMREHYKGICNKATTPIVNGNAVRAASALALPTVENFLKSIDPLFSVWIE